MYIVYVYIYIYLYMYAYDIQSYCVCVCEDVREGMMEKKKTHLRGSSLYYVYHYISPGQGDCRELKLKSTRGK